MFSARCLVASVRVVLPRSSFAVRVLYTPHRCFASPPRATEEPTTYYERLNVSMDATADTIKAAYRRCALQYHPDLASPDEAEEHAHVFRQVTEAYQCLQNTDARRAYDISIRGIATKRTNPTTDSHGASSPQDFTPSGWTRYNRFRSGRYVFYTRDAAGAGAGAKPSSREAEQVFSTVFRGASLDHIVMEVNEVLRRRRSRRNQDAQPTSGAGFTSATSGYDALLRDMSDEDLEAFLAQQRQSVRQQAHRVYGASSSSTARRNTTTTTTTTRSDTSRGRTQPNDGAWMEVPYTTARTFAAEHVPVSSVSYPQLPEEWTLRDASAGERQRVGVDKYSSAEMLDLLRRSIPVPQTDPLFSYHWSRERMNERRRAIMNDNTGALYSWHRPY